MINAPLARAASTNFFTFGTVSAQRLRFSGVQVCTVKSITSSAVSLGTSVTGLSCGGGGTLALVQSSMMVPARAVTAANSSAAATAAIEVRDISSSLFVLRKLMRLLRSALLGAL